jgi:hypothetical protein
MLWEKITGRRIHSSPAASSFIDQKMKNHGRALQPARGLMWFCPFENSLIRQTSTLGRQRKIILAPKAKRVKVVKGVSSGHGKLSSSDDEHFSL